MLEWIWDNISNIDSLLTIIKVSVLLVVAVFSIISMKFKSNQYKGISIPLKSMTKQSMKYYIPTRGQRTDPSDEKFINYPSIKLLPFFTKYALKKTETQYFIILADSGMGKTTFLLKLYSEYNKKIIKKNSIVYIPLALEKSIDMIREVKNKPNAILLLDGLDEDPYAMEDYSKRLKDIYRETELFYSVIISCRTQFFPNQNSEPEYIKKRKIGTGNKGIRFEKFYISPFNDNEIDLFLKKKYNIFFERKKIKRSKELITNCHQLMIRPMLLAYIDDLLVSKRNTYDYAYKIYKELVYRWIERESLDRKYKVNLYIFSEKLAEFMYLKKTLYVLENDISKLCDEYNIQIRNIEAKSRSLLNRTVDGKYKFAHKSILEYFLADKAYTDLEFRKSITNNKFNGYDMAKLFLEEMCNNYVNKLYRGNPFELESSSFDFFQLSKRKFSGNIINCNFEGSNLFQAYFGGIVIKDTNLQKTDMREANMRETKLINTNLSYAYLDGADFTNAILLDTVISENQINYLEKMCDLQCTKIYVKIYSASYIISYKKYLARHHKKRRK